VIPPAEKEETRQAVRIKLSYYNPSRPAVAGWSCPRKKWGEPLGEGRGGERTLVLTIAGGTSRKSVMQSQKARKKKNGGEGKESGKKREWIGKKRMT